MHVNVIFVTLVLVATSATIVLLFKDESGIIRILFVNIWPKEIVSNSIILNYATTDIFWRPRSQDFFSFDFPPNLLPASFSMSMRVASGS